MTTQMPSDFCHYDLSWHWTRKRTRASHHARERMQQRAIPKQMVELVQDWGCVRHCGGGCASYSFDKKSWECFSKANRDQAKAFERARNIFVVIGRDGGIVTVAHRW